MLLAESYLHTLDPFAIRFSQDFGIRWYGMSYAFGFLVAWAIIRWIARKQWSLLPHQRVGDFMFAAIFGVLLGGRLGYALFYEPHLFTGFTSSFPFWDLLAINKGGMASHGGMIGVVIACVWWGRRNRVDPLHLLDYCGLTATIGLGVGRIANFVNAELWGKALPAAMQKTPPWWSVKYPQVITERWLPALTQGDKTEVQFNSAVSTVAADFHIDGAPNELPVLVATAVQDRLDEIYQGLAPIIGGEGQFYSRAEQLARDGGAALHDKAAEVIAPLLTAYYPSQIYQAITDGPILLAALVLIWLKPRRPGAICAAFLTVYGVLRIITEMYRQPDIGVPLSFGLLSRGQTLSVLMILAGLSCWWLINRRRTPPIGGILAP